MKEKVYQYKVGSPITLWDIDLDHAEEGNSYKVVKQEQQKIVGDRSFAELSTEEVDLKIYVALNKELVEIYNRHVEEEMKATVLIIRNIVVGRPNDSSSVPYTTSNVNSLWLERVSKYQDIAIQFELEYNNNYIFILDSRLLKLRS